MVLDGMGARTVPGSCSAPNSQAGTVVEASATVQCRTGTSVGANRMGPTDGRRVGPKGDAPQPTLPRSLRPSSAVAGGTGASRRPCARKSRGWSRRRAWRLGTGRQEPRQAGTVAGASPPSPHPGSAGRRLLHVENEGDHGREPTGQQHRAQRKDDGQFGAGVLPGTEKLASAQQLAPKAAHDRRRLWLLDTK